MGKIDVVAIAPGFYGGQRKRIGDFFSVDSEKVSKKKGKLPSWMEEVVNAAEAKAKAAKAKKAAEDKQIAGAQAASGGKVAKDKAAEMQELVG